MRIHCTAAHVPLVLLFAAAAAAQFETRELPSGKGTRLGEPFVQRYQVGVKISAGSGPCRGIVATVPVPVDWPEQQVKVDAEEISANVAGVRYQELGEGLKQMAVSVPFLPAGQTAQALVTYEITRYTLLPPENPESFTIPKRIAAGDRRHLGHSPLIESRHGEIRAKARQLLADRQDAPAWQQVEAIYDWVHQNISHRRGEPKGALHALRAGSGDDEDITSLFIALARAAGVPARTVWIPDGCYAEFLLADEEGENHWFPCRPSGERAFGEINYGLAILQKGDNFKVPQHREPVRFVPEHVQGSGGRPSVEFIRLPLR